MLAGEQKYVNSGLRWLRASPPFEKAAKVGHLRRNFRKLARAILHTRKVDHSPLRKGEREFLVPRSD